MSLSKSVVCLSRKLYHPEIPALHRILEFAVLFSYGNELNTRQPRGKQTQRNVRIVKNSSNFRNNNSEIIPRGSVTEFLDVLTRETGTERK